MSIDDFAIYGEFARRKVDIWKRIFLFFLCVALIFLLAAFLPTSEIPPIVIEWTGP